MKPSLIRLSSDEIRLVYDEELMRKVAHDLIVSYRNLQFELVCGTLEAAEKSIKEYCRAIGRSLVLTADARIVNAYLANRGRDPKNARLQRVARQGASAAAARLSILSDLRQKRAFNPMGAGKQRNKIKQHGVQERNR